MSKKAVLIPAVLGVLVPAAIAFLMVFRGEICAMTWSGKDTLRCSSEITIRDKNVTLDKHVLYAESKCRATLVNVEFDSPHPIYLQSGARLVLKNSRIKARKHAIYVGSGAQVRIEKSTIESDDTAVYVGSDARVRIRGGKLKGTSKVLYAGTNGEVKIQGAQLHGTLYAGTRARVNIKGGKLTADGKEKRALYAGSQSEVRFEKTEVAGSIYTGTKAKVRGAVITALPKRWHCRGDTEATLRAIQLTGGSTPLSVSDRCRLRIVKSHLRGSHSGLNAQDKAQVTVIGGKLEGGRYAVRARGEAQVTLQKVALEGKIQERDEATVTRGDEKKGKGGVALPDAR
jgi:hypothetical protein